MLYAANCGAFMRRTWFTAIASMFLTKANVAGAVFLKSIPSSNGALQITHSVKCVFAATDPGDAPSGPL